MSDGFIARQDDGTIKILGTDHGCKGIVLSENDDFIAIKWPGHSSYRGTLLGPEYIPPKICVYAKEKSEWSMIIDDGRDRSKAENVRCVIEWDAGRKKKP